MKTLRLAAKDPFLCGNALRTAVVLAALVLSPSAIHPAQAASWITNGPLSTARTYHTATY